MKNTRLDWIAIRLFCQEGLDFKRFVEERGIDCYIPAREMRNGKPLSVLQPLLHNIVFVHESKEMVDTLIADYKGVKAPEYLYDMFMPANPYNGVNDATLQTFRRVLNEDAKSGLITISPVTIINDGYFKSEIVSGSLVGVRGLAHRSSRSSNVRLIVTLCCNLAVQTAAMPIEFIMALQ